MPQISVIVPIYNTEKYLIQCIESLIFQTLKDIEIILVNDGSTDNSLKICEQYARKDSRITIFNKENEGLAKARRDGIKIAKAEYISFLDSDDYYEPQFCEVMYKRMICSNADLIECDYYTISNNKKREHILYDADMDLNKELFHTNIVKKTIVNGTEAVVVWNKLYRKCMIENAIFDYGSSPLEDYVFNTQYYTMVERYAYIHECLTNYRQIPTSLSRKLDMKTIQVLKQTEIVKQKCMEQMELNSSDNLLDAATWFTSYVQGFLFRLLLVKQDNWKGMALHILNDPIVQQQCTRSANRSGFARAVAERKFKAALFYMKMKIYLFRFKQLGVKFKRILRQ